MVAKAAWRFFFPGGLPLIAAAVFLRADALAVWLPTVMSVYPYGVVAVGILLGWRFNRSRLVFAMVVLAIADRAALHLALQGAKLTSADRLAYDALTVLLPLNLALLCLTKERGVFTARGLGRAVFILMQPVAVVFLLRSGELNASRFLRYRFVEHPFLDQLPFPQPALLACGLAFVIVIANFISRQGVIDSGFFWALLCALLPLAGDVEPLEITFYFATSGLVLVLSLLESSYSMAFRDELTGLPARRALNEAFLRLGSRYAIAMVDVDYFKRFNDRHGHDAGDQALRMVAAKLSRVKGGALAFRYGGEEFTVLFPNRSTSQAKQHLERLRKEVESAEFALRDRQRPRKKPEGRGKARRPARKAPVTISIGVADCNEKRGSPQLVMKAADKALYRAKKGGRNRIRSCA